MRSFVGMWSHLYFNIMSRYISYQYSNEFERTLALSRYYVKLLFLSSSYSTFFVLTRVTPPYFDPGPNMIDSEWLGKFCDGYYVA